MQRQPLNVDRAVSFLLRKYGCCGLGVALERRELCVRAENMQAAREWALVAARLRSLMMAQPEGHLH